MTTKKTNWNKIGVIVGLVCFVISISVNIYFYVNQKYIVNIYESKSDILTQEVKKLQDENKNLNQKIDKLENKEKPIISKTLSKYIAHDEENFEIIYGDKTIGFLKIPKITDQFYLYLQDWNGSTKSGSTEIFVGNINKEELLNNLGKYIDTANSIPKRLIISANNEKFGWEAANQLKWGASLNSLKPMKHSKMWSPQTEKVYDMQGCFNCK